MPVPGAASGAEVQVLVRWHASAIVMQVMWQGEALWVRNVTGLGGLY
jgi:hypothetical protein